jgi:MOSC domain-containing protein YiiM
MGHDAATDPMDRTWISGFYKAPVEGPRRVGAINLDGDGQADLVNHGGPDKAICAYSADHYEFWRGNLDNPDLPFGAFGENFTIGGLTEIDVCIGDTWRFPDLEVQVSQPRQPCWKLARHWRTKDLADRVVKNGRTGWYFRVLAEGVVSSGQPLTLVDRPFPDWTITRVNQLIHHDKHNLPVLAELAAIPLLSFAIRDWLAKRLEQGKAS